MQVHVICYKPHTLFWGNLNFFQQFLIFWAMKLCNPLVVVMKLWLYLLWVVTECHILLHCTWIKTKLRTYSPECTRSGQFRLEIVFKVWKCFLSFHCRCSIEFLCKCKWKKSPVIEKKIIVMHQISHRYVVCFGHGIPLGVRGWFFFVTISGSGKSLVIILATSVADNKVVIHLGHFQKLQSCTAYSCFETFRKHPCHVKSLIE